MNKYLKILLTTSIFLAIPSITLAKENMNKRELPKEVKECMSHSTKLDKYI